MCEIHIIKRIDRKSISRRDVEEMFKLLSFGSKSNKDAWGVFNENYAYKKSGKFNPKGLDISSLSGGKFIIGHNRLATGNRTFIDPWELEEEFEDQMVLNGKKEKLDNLGIEVDLSNKKESLFKVVNSQNKNVSVSQNLFFPAFGLDKIDNSIQGTMNKVNIQSNIKQEFKWPFPFNLLIWMFKGAGNIFSSPLRLFKDKRGQTLWFDQELGYNQMIDSIKDTEREKEKTRKENELKSNLNKLKGNHKVNRYVFSLKNHHPFILDDLVLVHNGVISNDSSLFDLCKGEKLNYDRTITTDSYSILCFIKANLRLILEEQGVTPAEWSKSNDEFRKKNIIKSIKHSMKEVDGTYSIFLFDRISNSLFYFKNFCTDFNFKIIDKKYLVGSTEEDNLDYTYFDETKKGEKKIDIHNLVIYLIGEGENPVIKVGDIEDKSILDIFSDPSKKREKIKEDLKKLFENKLGYIPSFNLMGSNKSIKINIRANPNTVLKLGKRLKIGRIKELEDKKKKNILISIKELKKALKR